MLDLIDFKKPLVNFQRGANMQYYRKYPANLNQTFPMPTLPPPLQQPRIYQENIKQKHLLYFLFIYTVGTFLV